MCLRKMNYTDICVTEGQEGGPGTGLSILGRLNTDKTESDALCSYSTQRLARLCWTGGMWKMFNIQA